MIKSFSNAAPQDDWWSSTLVVSLWLRSRSWWGKPRHMASAFHELSDFQLKDIGLRRDQIDWLFRP